MAHPIIVAEQAVRSFISQWCSGLRPILRLSTEDDGCIKIVSEVSSFPASSINKRRHSGRGARSRRRLHRSTTRSNSLDNPVDDTTDEQLAAPDQPPQKPINSMYTTSSTQTIGNVLTFNKPKTQAVINIDENNPSSYTSDDSSFCFTTALDHHQASPNMAVPLKENEVCRFCDEEFSSWDEFLTHLKLAGYYLCNNCLDYFSDKPWSSILELGWISAGVGVKINPDLRSIEDKD